MYETSNYLTTQESHVQDLKKLDVSISNIYQSFSKKHTRCKNVLIELKNKIHRAEQSVLFSEAKTSRIKKEIIKAETSIEKFELRYAKLTRTYELRQSIVNLQQEFARVIQWVDAVNTHAKIISQLSVTPEMPIPLYFALEDLREYLEDSLFIKAKKDSRNTLKAMRSICKKNPPPSKWVIKTLELIFPYLDQTLQQHFFHELRRKDLNADVKTCSEEITVFNNLKNFKKIASKILKTSIQRSEKRMGKEDAPPLPLLFGPNQAQTNRNPFPSITPNITQNAATSPLNQSSRQISTSFSLIAPAPPKTERRQTPRPQARPVSPASSNRSTENNRITIEIPSPRYSPIIMSELLTPGHVQKLYENHYRVLSPASLPIRTNRSSTSSPDQSLTTL